MSAAEDFIRARLVLTQLPFRRDISLYLPTPQSGLAGFLESQGHAGAPPYWAYAWAGGAALALYLRDNPQSVSGKSVLDFGAGSGLVGIAAALAGASGVTAFEPDPLGRIALGLNAEANGVNLKISEGPEATDMVLAGDVFYDAKTARTTLPILRALARDGATVLVGDPFRRDLPLAALEHISEYDVPDMGSGTPARAAIFTLRP